MKLKEKYVRIGFFIGSLILALFAFYYFLLKEDLIMGIMMLVQSFLILIFTFMPFQLEKNEKAKRN